MSHQPAHTPLRPANATLMAIRKQARKLNYHSIAHLDLLEGLVTARRRPPKSTTVRAFASLRHTVLADLNLVEAKANERHARSLDAAHSEYKRRLDDHIASSRVLDESVSEGHLGAQTSDDQLNMINMNLLRIGETVETDDEMQELEARLEATEEELQCLLSDDEDSGTSPSEEL